MTKNPIQIWIGTKCFETLLKFILGQILIFYKTWLHSSMPHKVSKSCTLIETIQTAYKYAIGLKEVTSHSWKFLYLFIFPKNSYFEADNIVISYPRFLLFVRRMNSLNIFLYFQYLKHQIHSYSIPSYCFYDMQFRVFSLF